MIRSTTRNKPLDETALFDCVCRHDCPIMLFNMDKGRSNVIVVLPIFYRRLSYALCNGCTNIAVSSQLHVYLTYDISCTSEKYLKS